MGMRKIKSRFLILLIAISAGIIVLEIGERLFNFMHERKLQKIRESYNLLFMKSPNEGLGFEFRPNVNLDLKSVKGIRYSMHVKTNSLGLREDQDIPLTKPRDTIRIIGLGDSIMFGASVDNDQTMLKWMEKFGQRKGLRVQTLNFGIAPSDPEHTYRYFVYKKGLSYHPDILILGFSLHDFSDITHKEWLEEWVETISGGPKTKILDKISNKKRRENDSLNNSEYYYADSLETCMEAKAPLKYWIKKIYHLAEDTNIKFFVVIFPLREQLKCLLEGKRISLYPQETALQICRELNIDCYDTTFDMLKVIKENNYNLSDIYWDSAHPYKLGHKILGELILEFLFYKGYITTLRAK